MDASANQASESIPQSPISQSLQLSRQLQLKHAYVACELLTSENKAIGATIVTDDNAMAKLFACLERADPGALEPLVAVHFSKIVIALLKTHNAQLVQKLSSRPSFLPVILKHMDCAALAELLVRILDAPEPDANFSEITKRPTEDALNLLAEADLLGGLAQCFVRASGEQVDLQRTVQDDMANKPDVASTPISALSEEERAKQRRLREETMANVSITINGLTDRMLQLPEMGVPIPLKLSPFSTPQVISRILDAGLYAYSNGMVDANGVPRAFEEPTTNEERVVAFSAGNNSALLNSLGLVADLMTTEANVYRDDDDELGHSDFEHATVIRPVSIGVGKPMFIGKGIGPSVAAAYAASKVEANERQQPSKPKPLPELANKKAGDPIVETTALQRELALRFPRLSEMFGQEVEEDTGDHQIRPLGSLRLKLAEFFVACMKNASQETVDQITERDVPKKLLSLFSTYQWSSMLHSVVTKSIVDSFDKVDRGRPSRTAWLQAGLIPWLIESWSQDAKVEEQSDRKRSRAGYMGHLIRIGTALKFYIEEFKHEEHADMPERSQLDAFSVFAREALDPARKVEITPLCDMRSEEEVDATDLLDMSKLNFAGGGFGPGAGAVLMPLGQHSAERDNDIEEEDEIKPIDVDVDVSELEQFAAEVEDARNARAVDHDIPSEMRARLSKEVEEVEEVRPIPDPSEQEDLLKPYSTPKSRSRDRSQKAYMSRLRDTRDIELDEVIDTVDSSSDDDESYEAFVDTRAKTTRRTSEVVEKFSNLKMVDSEPGSASLAGAVTEIEEEAVPLTPESNIMQLATNVISVVDDAVESSDDDDYEEWHEPSRVGVFASSQQHSQTDPPQTGESGDSAAKVG